MVTRYIFSFILFRSTPSQLMTVTKGYINEMYSLRVYATMRPLRPPRLLYNTPSRAPAANTTTTAIPANSPSIALAGVNQGSINQWGIDLIDQSVKIGWIPDLTRLCPPLTARPTDNDTMIGQMYQYIHTCELCCCYEMARFPRSVVLFTWYRYVHIFPTRCSARISRSLAWTNHF